MALHLYRNACLLLIARRRRRHRNRHQGALVGPARLCGCTPRCSSPARGGGSRGLTTVRATPSSARYHKSKHHRGQLPRCRVPASRTVKVENAPKVWPQRRPRAAFSTQTRSCSRVSNSLRKQNEHQTPRLRRGARGGVHQSTPYGTTDVPLSPQRAPLCWRHPAVPRCFCVAFSTLLFLSWHVCVTGK